MPIVPHLMQPNILVLLLALGGLLVCVEFNAPGIVVPGAVGLFLILLALFELHRMHLQTWAAALLLIALALLLLEAKFFTRGVLALLGIAALVVALAHLVAADDPRARVSWGVAAGAGVGFGVVACGLAALGERARRTKILTGAEAMLGQEAVAQTVLLPEGQVLVRGEIWAARLGTIAGAAKGQRLRVVAVEGLVLIVEPSTGDRHCALD